MTQFIRVLFPQPLTNEFPGHKFALYIFMLLTVVTLARSLVHVFFPDGGAQSIATIPLNTFSTGAAGVVVGMFAHWGLSQLLLGTVYAIACIRYRAAIPLLYVFFIVEYLARLGLAVYKPVLTVNTPPAQAGNLLFPVLGLAMLALCFAKPRTAKE